MEKLHKSSAILLNMLAGIGLLYLCQMTGLVGTVDRVVDPIGLGNAILDQAYASQYQEDAKAAKEQTMQQHQIPSKKIK